MKELIKKIDHRVLERLYYQWILRVEREVVGTCESLLDVGCGPHSPIARFSERIPHVVGLDIFEPSIERSRALGIHNDYIIGNVLDITSLVPQKSFDAVVALDLIEHLTKEDGYRLIDGMESVARRKVVIFTPNGFLPQEPYDGNIYQRHISGWSAAEMEERGYHVYGIQGWKPLRGELAAIRNRPKFFWTYVSLFSQLVTETRPDKAFQLLCIKEIEG
jgi:hypothetical protein